MSDIIERAEMIDRDLNAWSRIQRKIGMWPKLVAALRDALAENEKLRRYQQDKSLEEPLNGVSEYPPDNGALQ